MGQDRPLEIAEPLSFRHGRRSCAAYPPQTQDRAAARFIPGNIPVAEKPPDFSVPQVAIGHDEAPPPRKRQVDFACGNSSARKFSGINRTGDRSSDRHPQWENDNDQAVNS
jgi:hypothetical protein